MAPVVLSIGFNVQAQPQPLQVTPTNPTENLFVGVPVDGVVVANVTGGIPPYQYNVDPASGALPDGVGLSEDNGVISMTGTPTTAGQNSTYVLDITDSSGQQASAKIGKTAAPPAPKKAIGK